VRDEALGVVRLDVEKCIACGACADGCPFGMVTIRPSDGLPLICDLCDGDPSCVKRCASGAIRWAGADEPARDRREGLARRHLRDRSDDESGTPADVGAGPRGASGVPSIVYRAGLADPARRHATTPRTEGQEEGPE
jgi:Fe-S-cluster-containing dehydrogenase component